MKYYKVKLMESGPSKLSIIKIVKETLYRMTLRHCKNLVDNPPSSILLTSDRTEARNLTTTLRKAGATIKSTIHIINT